jgi:hypothetical protein
LLACENTIGAPDQPGRYPLIAGYAVLSVQLGRLPAPRADSTSGRVAHTANHA